MSWNCSVMRSKRSRGYWGCQPPTSKGIVGAWPSAAVPPKTAGRQKVHRLCTARDEPFQTASHGLDSAAFLSEMEDLPLYLRPSALFTGSTPTGTADLASQDRGLRARLERGRCGVKAGSGKGSIGMSAS
ncbi:hypothetical protein DEDE109153_16375 [Deinococcus deserti]|uniref:Uncharacterized protein n=1 Tax=Deinococcus deserti (strain DSM 17065 / CIP 109153 / LMG 22923 / VCD115) TaxID=546414 RepID=C1D291_DEIDV|nr:Hypothetical protein Deide_1p01071 [Deinococcus deserti VCD115]